MLINGGVPFDLLLIMNATQYCQCCMQHHEQAERKLVDNTHRIERTPTTTRREDSLRGGGYRGVISHHHHNHRGNAVTVWDEWWMWWWGC
mmetsp:Transcript_17518/g.31701  ORF Transcript_17518/g.31701 Transcript_17518/m.31701 type:complete len:90 (+) Transcript_17518:228-497(+)